MAALKVLLLVTLFITYCSGQNAPCTPTVKNEAFTDFMESMNCAVDKNLLNLFASNEVFKNSIVKNPYSNFMCIGLMDALALVPETLCDVYNPLGDIQDGDFCSSSKLATLRKISNSSMFDEKSNFVTVSKYTEEKCKLMCKDDTNHLCWAFGIIAEAVLKYTQSTNVPTTVPPPAVTPQPSTESELPALISQHNDSPGSDGGDVDIDGTNGDKGRDEVPSDKPKDSNHTDGGDVNIDGTNGDKGRDEVPTDRPKDNNHTEDVPSDDGGANTEDTDGGKGGDEVPTDKPGDNNHTEDVPGDDEVPTDKPEDTDKTPTITTTTSDGDFSDYFDKIKVSNNPESVNKTPNAEDGDGKESSKGSNEDKNAEIKEHQSEGPLDIGVPIVNPGNDDIDDNHTQPLEVGGGDGNQIVNSTKDQSQPGGTEIGNSVTDTDAEDGTEGNNDTQDSAGEGLDGNDDNTDENSDQDRVNFNDTIDDDDDGYSYWHFAAILLFILFLGVAGYLASLNRKKIRESVSTYMSKRKRKREYKPVNTMEAGLS